MLRRGAPGLLLAVYAGLAGGAPAIDFDQLRARAHALSQAAYVAPPAPDAALAQVDPARVAGLRVLPRRAPWTMYSRFVPLPLAPRPDCAPTQFRSIQASGIEHFEYRPALFDWAAVGVPAPGPAAAGFCGFDLLYRPAARGGPLGFARFGGDAWQLAGATEVHGAQALVVGEIGGDGRVQAVPFREFWLLRPAARARQLRVYALAESAALAAAVQIDLLPDTVNRAQVRVAVYPRAGLGAVLLAPLAGEFVQGEQRPGDVLPLQAERHSVDGLAIHGASGGWVWRPLDNPREPTAHGFAVGTPRGYGLLQRDRAPGHYEPGAPHPQQPDLWLVPQGDWGAGQLRLIETPLRDGGARNVLVGFVPDRQPAAGDELSLSYTALWSTGTELPQPGAWVVATRSGAADREGSRRYAIDFAGPAFQALPPGALPVAVIDVGRGGSVRRQRVVVNPDAGGWRLLFDIDRETDGALPLRAYLQHADQPLSETWDYVDPPR